MLFLTLLKHPSVAGLFVVSSSSLVSCLLSPPRNQSGPPSAQPTLGERICFEANQPVGIFIALKQPAASQTVFPIEFPGICPWYSGPWPVAADPFFVLCVDTPGRFSDPAPFGSSLCSLAPPPLIAFAAFLNAAGTSDNSSDASSGC